MKQYENEMQHALELYLNGSEEHDLHASEVAYLLKKIRSEDKEAFYLALSRLPQDARGDVLIKLSEKLKDEAITFYSTKELAEAVEGLESDDAADLVQDIDESAPHYHTVGYGLFAPFVLQQTRTESEPGDAGVQFTAWMKGETK